MPHPPTPEQAAIIYAAGHSTASLMISAYAGTAKTTTIEMLASHLKTPSVLALAFNVKIKQELEARLPKTFTVKTMNGLGHSAWAKATGKRLTLDIGKIGKLITATAKATGLTLEKDRWVAVKDLVEAARTIGLVPSAFPHAKSYREDTSEAWLTLAEENDISATEALCTFARSVLIESIKQSYTGLIDFSDQIYMSVCFGGVFPRFHTTIVDEAQDLSPMNHQMVRRATVSRLIICGDPKQSLYQFRGAASDSMGKIRPLQALWEDYALTVTFRCPKVLVERQHYHAPGFTAAEGNPMGKVVELPNGLAKVPDWAPDPDASWSFSDLLRAINIPEGQRLLPDTLAILSRNNAPLITMAFKLIRRGQGIKMLGRDLGKGLILTIRKIVPQAETPIKETCSALQTWFERESSILAANKKESASEKLSDRYESICAVVESVDLHTQGELCSTIESLFSKDSGLITLATAHRAKGLEWPHVLHLDPWRIPSRWAKSEEALLQETNARYVIETRAKETLILADLETFK